MRTQNPLVSIIVPVYNVEKYLDKCIESLVNQTLEDIEIIILDDGSTDNSPAICDKFAKKDERIIVIHKKNEGLGLTRNAGMRTARGKYIGFVDSDDYVDSNMYADLYSAAEKCGADAAYGGIYYVQENGVITKSDFVSCDTVWKGKEQMCDLLMHFISSPIDCPEDALFGATVWKGIFLKEKIDEYKVCFYSERDYVSEDSIFDVDILTKLDSAIMLKGNYYYYRYNPSSLTASYRKDRFLKNKELYYLIKDKLWEAYHSEDILIQYGRAFIAASRVCIMQEVYNKKNAGWKKTYENMLSISNDELLQSILQKYPWKRLPFKKRIFAFFMKNRLVLLQYIIVKLNA